MKLKAHSHVPAFSLPDKALFHNLSKTPVGANEGIVHNLPLRTKSRSYSYIDFREPWDGDQDYPVLVVEKK